METKEIEKYINLKLRMNMSIFLYIASVSLIQFMPSSLSLLGTIASFGVVFGIIILLIQMIKLGDMCTKGYYLLLFGYIGIIILDINSWGNFIDRIRLLII